ncbi:hypothetical protein CXG81DRAFT_3084, partial [Caulochytrium protostelioides]
YDLKATLLALHPCGVNAVAATEDMRWLFTGGEDGLIRKFDFVASRNGEQPLTLTQRHGLPESMWKAGFLASAWENDEYVAPPSAPPPPPPPPPAAAAPATIPSAAPADPPARATKVSPVHSIAVHSQGVWALSGCENGQVNLWSVRHDEGTLIHAFRHHTKAVAAITILPDEHGFVSGAWDRGTRVQSLDTGAIVQSYDDAQAQVIAVAMQPYAGGAGSVPASEPGAAAFSAVGGIGGPCSHRGRHPAVMMAASFDGAVRIYDIRTPSSTAQTAFLAGGAARDQRPPWAVGVCWSTEGTHLYVGRRDCAVDELDLRMTRVSRTLRFPRGSGPVTAVMAMPNGNKLLCASFDNLRMYNLLDGHVDPAAGAGAGAGAVKNERETAAPAMPHHPPSTEPMAVDGAARLTVKRDPDGVPPSASWDLDMGGMASDALAGPADAATPLSAPVAKKRRKWEEDATTPYEIIPGHHGGIIAALYLDPSGRFAVSASGTRGWDATTTNLCFVYDVESQEAP